MGRKKLAQLPWELQSMPERLRRAMQHRGVRTQVQLEKMCDGLVDQPTISRVLSGTSLRGVTAETVLGLSKGLRVSCGWLLAAEQDSIPAARQETEPPQSSIVPSSGTSR